MGKYTEVLERIAAAMERMADAQETMNEMLAEDLDDEELDDCFDA